jgi:DNA-binding NarL/FixJ family response regulator
VAAIRILLAQLPRHLQDYFNEAVASQDDMRLVGSLANPLDVLLAVGSTNADVVILGVGDDAVPAIATHLYDEYPDVRLLGVTPDGHQAYLYELSPHPISIGELSPNSLVEVIRSTVCPEVG